jgi:polyisoprenyl-teichoic acid--peptidoglycan teichoic acid transferase
MTETINDNTKAPEPIVNKQIHLPRWRVTASKIKRRVFKHIWLLRGLIVLGLIVLLIGLAALLFPLFSDTKFGRYVSFARDFITTPEEKVTMTNGRVNILILGKGGAGHEAPDLTDTMIFASLSPENKSVGLISIPRDIWIPSIRAKVNSSYYWGNQKQPPKGEDLGGGVILAKSSVEEIVGEHIHYGVIIDFDGFKDIVDVLGGIDVDIKNSFVDERYPVAGKENEICPTEKTDEGEVYYPCRYELITFTKGLQHMDGETALKFVRSRYAEGDEGTDLARAGRQQLVLNAIKEKVLTEEILFSPKKIRELLAVADKVIETDMTEEEIVIITRWIYEARDNINSHVLPEELLYNPPISPKYDNLYVFIPEGDDPETPENEWNNVHEWVNEVLN